MNKNRSLILLFVLMLTVALSAACAAPGQPAAAANPTAAAPAAVKTTKDVTAQGRLLPQRSASLSLASGGVIAEVAVHEGDQVQAGQLILRLRNEQQAAAVA